MLYPGLVVKKGTKVGDIDPRGTMVDYNTISDKARAIGGGVLEAILNYFNR
jgi:xanthine dehydrogenase accessory factor